MRTNGLTASAYRPVADLDPLVAESLLADLASRGVAAYTKPVETPTTVGLDGVDFRVRLKERLYVDARAPHDIDSLIAGTPPTSNLNDDGGEDELAWAQIVAGYDLPSSGEAVRWPAIEDVQGEAPVATVAASSGADAPPVDAVPGTDEFFVPPEPPPLPHLDVPQQLAWLGLAGGPLLLFIAALFTVTLPVWLSLAAVIGFVGGFLTLVATMEDRRPPEGDSDDGAVL